MLADQYRELIARRVLDLAVEKYPNDIKKQMIYQIGFLQAQLAQAMTDDNKYANRFASAIRNVQETI